MESFHSHTQYFFERRFWVDGGHEIPPPIPFLVSESDQPEQHLSFIACRRSVFQSSCVYPEVALSARGLIRRYSPENFTIANVRKGIENFSVFVSDVDSAEPAEYFTLLGCCIHRVDLLSCPVMGHP